MKGATLLMHKYNQYIEALSYDELRVFKLLEGLDPMERITGIRIMERLGIKDRRYLYSLVENIRKKGLPVIGGKQINDKGYKLARTREELQRYLKSCRAAVDTQIRTMSAMQRFSDELFNEGEDIA